MAERRRSRIPSLLVRSDQPLIGVLTKKDGEEVAEYFAEEEMADSTSSPASVQKALNLAGAWGDLDWREMEAALERIRRESVPTPPVDL